MLLDEIAAYLASKGVGTVSSNILKGSNAVIPNGDGPFLSLIETGGSAPTRIHNVPGAHTQRPTVQVVCRATSYGVARTMAKSAYAALDGTFNTSLSGVFYQKIAARQEPTSMGVDAQERPLIVFNVDVEKEAS